MSLSEVRSVSTVAEVIKERRTVRLFKSDPVPTPLLLELLNVAVWAPNHENRQPWRFILFKEEGRTVLANAMLATYSAEEKHKHGIPKFNYFMEVPVHLIVLVKEDPRQKQWDEDYAAVCCLIQNFQLAAWEQGLGVVWKTNNYNYNPGFRETVGVRPGEKIAGVLHIGYPETVPKAQPRTAAEQLLTIIDSFE